MLLIDCPFCGARDEDEFFCAGAGVAVLPDMHVADVDVAGSLYFRDNTAGMIDECWVHRHGCGEWLVVRRDTTTHAIESVRFMRAASVRTGEPGDAA